MAAGCPGVGRRRAVRAPIAIVRPRRWPIVAAATAIAAAIEHLHVARDHLGGVAGLAVLALPRVVC